MLTYKESTLPSFSKTELNYDLDVLIFKTSIHNEEDAAKIKQLLDTLIDIRDCSIDLDDCDRVLRVTGIDLDAFQIIKMITAKGYECEILP